MKTYRAHVNWSVNFFSGGRWRPAPGSGRTGYVIPYTNARAINWGEEVRTFLDEWSTLDIADPRWPGEERFVRAKDGGYRLAAYGKVADSGGDYRDRLRRRSGSQLAGHGPPLSQADAGDVR